jgi:glycosyltransferase involved in cell wall biosynthesis
MVSRNAGGGGAAQVARRLTDELKACGNRVHFLAGFGSQDLDDATVKLVNRRPFARWLRQAAAVAAERISGYQYLLQPAWKELTRGLNFHEFDVVHFHNTHGSYAHLEIVLQASQAKPVVWTLHDSWALTGHCALPVFESANGMQQCERWQTGCGSCPALGPLWRDRTPELWQRKAGNAVLMSGRVVCVSPSNWMLRRAESSLLKPLTHRRISNAVTSNSFKPPVDRLDLRRRLQLPENETIIAFVGSGGEPAPIKGDPLLHAALRELAGDARQPRLIVIGNTSLPPGVGQRLGPIHDPEKMAAYLGAADALIVPSYIENQPLVVLEALSCGTPVVAFAVGGIPELITHERTGFLASSGNATELAAGIRWVMGLSADSRREARVAAVASVSTEFSLGQQCKNYLGVYEEAIAAWRRRP